MGKARSTGPAPTEKPLDGATDRAADAVLLLSRALVGVAAESVAATEAHITLRQYRALVVLASHGPQNVGALAEALDIHPTTLTRMCDRLVAHGWIERAPSPRSRREVTLALSDYGRSLVRRETERRRRAIRRIVDRLDPATQRVAADVVGALVAAAGQGSDQAWRLGWTA